jgi:CheY-like chemotaxis protein
MKIDKILCLVDDDDIYQYTFIKNLQGTNLSRDILLFSDGEMALEHMEQNLTNLDELPDIIFLDINMPVMDGWEFLEEFVKLKPNVGKEIVIYMVSSSIDPNDISRAREISEVTDYLIKPVTKEEVRAIIEAS